LNRETAASMCPHQAECHFSEHKVDLHYLNMGNFLLGPHLLHPHTRDVVIGPKGKCETWVHKPILHYPTIHPSTRPSTVMLCTQIV